MTQKELSYIEDAISHEGNIIKIINLALSNLEDEELVSFMNQELTIHESMKEKLLNHLEVESNEWSLIYG